MPSAAQTLPAELRVKGILIEPHVLLCGYLAAALYRSLRRSLCGNALSLSPS